MFERSRDRASLPKVENILLDGGYKGQPFADKIKKILDCSVEIVKRSDEHMFKVIPKRCVVERCFAWLEKARLWSERFQRVSRW
jgi:transposase